MDRNFLKDLGIEDKSVIDAILDRRGEEIEAVDDIGMTIVELKGELF